MTKKSNQTTYIVKRTSLSGGMEYLVEGQIFPYRWDKTRKANARRFTTKSAASRVARSNAGTIGIL